VSEESGKKPKEVSSDELTKEFERMKDKESKMAKEQGISTAEAHKAMMKERFEILDKKRKLQAEKRETEKREAEKREAEKREAEKRNEEKKKAEKQEENIIKAEFVPPDKPDIFKGVDEQQKQFNEQQKKISNG